MARPLSDGLPYIGLPTNWFRLPENKILRARLGANAVLIWTDLYLSSFEINGYYRAITDDDVAILADEYRVKDNFIREVLHFLASRSLADDTLLRTEKVLTSRDIQLTFQEAVRERGKKREIEVREGYWLLEKSETRPFIKVCPQKNYSGKNVGYSGKNGDKSGKNGSFSCRKEKKEKEKKGNEKIGLTRAEVSRVKHPVKLNGHMIGQSISRRGELIRREYTRICGSVLPAQEKVTDKQLSLIRKGTLGGYRMADYTAVFDAVLESGFLKGSNGKWRAAFQWLITPEKMAKVLAGEYRDFAAPGELHTTQKKPATGCTAAVEENSSYDTDEFFNAALRGAYGDLFD